MNDPATLDLVMPFHNEVETVEEVVTSWIAAAKELGVDARVVACEDGSTDGTRRLLLDLTHSVRVIVVGGDERKGYSKAMVDGLRTSTAPWVCTIDGDGQYDPGDLAALWARREVGSVIVGVRQPRRDTAGRLLMSQAMATACFALHHFRQTDTSSPFCLIPGPTARQLAAAEPVLPQGYWWEFHIRRRRMGISLVEVPVHHRVRRGGGTRVYLATQLIPIAMTHIRGLWRLRDLAKSSVSGRDRC